MSELPPLPESEDPFELLGIDLRDSDLDQRALKRAYVRLIKRYKPERAPKEFQRLRAAFEEARSSLEFRRIVAAAELEDEADELALIEALNAASSEERPEAEASKSGDSEEDPWGDGSGDDWGPSVEPLPPLLVRAWELLEEGQGEAAAASLRAGILAGGAGLVGGLFLIEEARGEPGERCLLVLEEALNRGDSVAEFLVSVVRERELRVLLQGDCGRWEVLRRQPERDQATGLWQRRLHALLLAGKRAQVRAEIEALELAADLAEFPGLRTVILELAQTFGWDAPEFADELFDVHARQEGLVDDWSPEARYSELRAGVSAWYGAEVSGAAPALARVLELGGVVEGEGLEAELVRLRDDARERPQDYLAVLDRMHAASPVLLVLVNSTLAFHFSIVEEIEELEMPLREAIAQRLKAIDQGLDEDSMNSFFNTLLALAVLLQVAALFSFGWWGLLGAPVLLLLVSRSWLYADRLYQKTVRLGVAEIIAEFPVSPTVLSAVLRDTSRVLDDIGRFDDAIDEDVSLHMYSWLVHLCSSQEPVILRLG